MKFELLKNLDGVSSEGELYFKVYLRGGSQKHRPFPISWGFKILMFQDFKWVYQSLSWMVSIILLKGSMSIANFEKDLINKLNYKASSKINPDAVLFKAFKFFDLNGVGYVPKSEFIRTIAKIGVVLDDPKEIDLIFNYYDKKRQGKIQYVDFIEEVLFRDTNDNPPATKPSPPISQSQYKPANNPAKSEAGSSKPKPRPLCSTVEQISNFIKQRLRGDGVSGLLKLATNMKNLDKDRTHFLQFAKYQLVFDFLDYKELQTFLKSFNSENGEINYAEVAYFLRGQQSHEVEEFLIQLFRDEDEDKEGEIAIQRLVQRYNGQKREQFNQAVNSYCKFQGIDDGVFTQDDFLDFYGFLSFYFQSQDAFRRYVTNTELEQPERSESRQSQSRREYISHNRGERSIYDNISEQNPNPNFKKNKEEPLDSPPRNKQYDVSSQDFSSDDKVSRKSMKSRASSQLTQTHSIRNIIERIKGSLSNKGTMRFFLFEKALRGVDFDQDSLINLSELRKVIKDFRIGISEIEAQILFQNFDTNGVGLMSYQQLVFHVKGETPQRRLKLIYKIWDRVKDTQQLTTFTKLKSIFQPRAHPDFKIAKRHEDEIKKQFIDTILLVQDLNGARSEDIDKDTFIEYLENVSASIEDDKFFDVAMIGLWKLSNDSNIEEQYAGSRKKFETGKKAYLQDFHKSTVIGGTSSDHAPFGTFKGPVNYTTQHRSAYQI